MTPGRIAWLTLVAVSVGLALAMLARLLLIEAQDLREACEAAASAAVSVSTWASLACALRESAVQLFIHHRLEAIACMLALGAAFSARAGIALAGAGLSAMGLVLYSAELSAPALLLALGALAWRWAS